MNLNTKRFISAILVSFFFIYSVIIYTVGTRVDKGEKFITERSRFGKLLFQQKNCIACHQLFGLGGYMGPDLTNVMSAPGKGPVYVRQFLQNGTTRMPNYHLTEAEIDAFVAYFTYTDKTGISPVKDFKVNYDGTVNWKHDDEKGN